MADLEKALTEDPPYGARVTAEFDTAAEGWDAPPLAGWLEAATEDASMTYFGKPAVYMGEGGTIPFMGMLGEKFPDAQFLITGAFGTWLQRARPQRVPAHPDGQEAHRLRGPPSHGACTARLRRIDRKFCKHKPQLNTVIPIFEVIVNAGQTNAVRSTFLIAGPTQPVCVLTTKVPEVRQLFERM